MQAAFSANASISGTKAACTQAFRRIRNGEPHLVADNDGEYLGVEFFAGTPAQFDRPYLAHCKPLYDIDYSPLLAAGTPFAIMEGGRCVGKGKVEMVVWGTA